MRRRIIALNGPAGSGKSVVADHLQRAHWFRLFKFAGPLKDMLVTFYKNCGLGDADILERIEGGLKEVPDPYLTGRTPRHAMQTMGTEWGRDCMSRDFWVEAWKSRVRKYSGPVVVDDCRFDNEAAAIKYMGGEIWSLRPAEKRRAASNHLSEQPLNIKPDFILVNDGTIEDLKRKATLELYPEAPETYGELR